MSMQVLSGWFTLCWSGNTVADQSTTFAFWLAVHVCIFSMCTSCVSVTECEVCVRFLCPTELWTSHCVLGKAIGRPWRVIKVKLLPPRLFLPAWWDNRRGSPSPLLFHTRPAFLPALLSWQLSPHLHKWRWISGKELVSVVKRVYIYKMYI